MINSFNFAFDTGTLSISQRRGIITLIPKPKKTPPRLRTSGQYLFLMLTAKY